MSPVPLILNPAAGGGRCGRAAPAAITRLREAGVELTVHATTGPGDATRFAREAWAAGHRRLLVAGGDGTTYEVLQGLYPLADPTDRPTLGMIPLGTGNSFLRDLGVEDAEGALAAVIGGRSRPVDVIAATLSDGVIHYVNLLSIGFTSDVGATTNRWFKPLGAGGYAVATVLEVVRLRARAFPHQLDDGPVDRAPYAFLSFSNSRCTGGTMVMAPDADVADGRVDVIRVGDLGRVGLLATFPRIYEGRHLEHPRNSGATAASVRFSLEGPLDLMVDGEVVRGHLQRLDVLPGALEVLA